MTTTRCHNGHFYDSHQHSACPFCGVQTPIETTVGAAAISPSRDEGVTRTRGAPSPPGRGGDPGVTRPVWQAQRGFDPVVGWLVCVEGPEKGRDFRIHGERNFIGRAPHMDIALTGDPAISREKHAILSFNPKTRVFRLLPGESRGLVYLNGEEVLGPLELKPYDQVELGASKLAFVPFCGDAFTWE